MTLYAGNQLFKVSPYDGNPAARLRAWVEEHPEGDISDAELAAILCPGEAYVQHEVMSDVHYEGHTDGFSFAPGVDLKVIR
jgi:hypothetical protein